MDLSKKEDGRAWTFHQFVKEQVVGCCEQSSKHTRVVPKIMSNNFL